MSKDEHIEKIIKFAETKDFDVLDYLTLQRELQDVLLDLIDTEDLDDAELEDDDLDIGEEEPAEILEEEKPKQEKEKKEEVPPNVPRLDKVTA